MPELVPTTKGGAINCITLETEHNGVEITVTKAGEDSPAQIKILLQQCIFDHVDAIQLDITITDEAASWLITAAEKMGYFFSGMFPRIQQGNDRCMMMYLNNIKLDYEQILLFSNKARKILEYVTRCHDTVSPQIKQVLDRERRKVNSLIRRRGHPGKGDRMKKRMSFMLLMTLLTTLLWTSTVRDSLEILAGNLSGIERARVLVKIAGTYWDTDAQKGMDYANEALTLAGKFHDSTVTAMAQQALGTNFWAMGQYQQAEEHSLKALEILEQNGIETGLSQVLGNLGLIYDYQGRSDKALPYLLRSLELSKKYEDYGSIINVSNNLGLLFSRDNDFEESLNYFQLSYDTQVRHHELRLLPYTLNNMGVIYLRMGNSQKAEDNFLEALAMERERKNDWGIAACQYNLSGIQFDRNDISQAINSIQESLKLRRKLSNPQTLTESLVRYGKFLIDQNRYAEASQILQESFALTDSFDLIYDKLFTLEQLVNLEKAQENYPQALTLLEQYLVVQDSIFTKERTTQINELRTKYELDTIEGENKLLRTTNQLHLLEIKRKNTVITAYFVLVVIVLILIFVIFLNYQNKRKANKLLAESNLLIRKQKDELAKTNQKLKDINATKDRFFSIIAHDIKNPLVAQLSGSKILLHHIQSMDSEATKAMAKEIRKNTFQLLGLLDNLLQWSRLQMKRIQCHPTPLVLAALVNRTFDLYKLKAANKDISLTNKVPMELLVLVDRDMMISVINNLITNAIKFSPTGTSITVSAAEEDEMVNIYFQDEGVGMDAETKDTLFRLDVSHTSRGTANERGTGLGLILVREFLVQNSGSIEIQSEVGKGTTIIVQVPVFHDVD